MRFCEYTWFNKDTDYAAEYADAATLELKLQCFKKYRRVVRG